MRTAALLRAGIVVASGLGLSGCFSYVPIELDTVPLGENVQVLMTRKELDQLRDLDDEGLPESGNPQVRGILVRRDAAELAVQLNIAQRQVGFHSAPILRQLTIPSGEVVQIERRELDRGRTALAIAGLAGLGGGVVVAILNGSKLWDANPDPPLPEALRVPIFSLRAP